MNSNIRKLRNEKNISQTTLANVLGKTQQTVSQMERDRNRISIESLIALADYFGVSTDYILGLENHCVSEKEVPRQMELQRLNSDRPEAVSDSQGINAEESKKTLYQLLLSFLLYSLEDDVKATMVPQESSV